MMASFLGDPEKGAPAKIRTATAMDADIFQNLKNTSLKYLHSLSDQTFVTLFSYHLMIRISSKDLA
jgi:hypothetical protein